MVFSLHYLYVYGNTSGAGEDIRVELLLNIIIMRGAPSPVSHAHTTANSTEKTSTIGKNNFASVSISPRRVLPFDSLSLSLSPLLTFPLSSSVGNRISNMNNNYDIT